MHSPNNYTDAELLQMMKLNDRDCFAAIYERYEGPLLKYAIRVTQNKEDAADILQEIFVSLWNRRAQIEFNHSLKAWLYQAVRFQAAKYICQNGKKNAFLNEMAQLIHATNSYSPDIFLEERELAATIRDAINSMPVKMKRVFVLSREEDLSHREIGLKLNIAESTVKKQVQKALRLIREISVIDSIALAYIFSYIF